MASPMLANRFSSSAQTEQTRFSIFLRARSVSAPSSAAAVITCSMNALAQTHRSTHFPLLRFQMGNSMSPQPVMLTPVRGFGWKSPASPVLRVRISDFGMRTGRSITTHPRSPSPPMSPQVVTNSSSAKASTAQEKTPQGTSMVAHGRRINRATTSLVLRFMT